MQRANRGQGGSAKQMCRGNSVVEETNGEGGNKGVATFRCADGRHVSSGKGKTEVLA